MLIIMGKTASGKNLIRDKLVAGYGFKSLITYTTRPMRDGEIQDETYHFISEKDFLDKIKHGFFAEWNKYDTDEGTWYYGSAKEDYLNCSDNTVVILTPSGVKSIRALGINAYIVYIHSSLLTIQARQKSRKDNPEEADRRIMSDEVDFAHAYDLCDAMIYNNISDDINIVVDKVQAYYKGRR